jgi:hypothetical protein
MPVLAFDISTPKLLTHGERPHPDNSPVFNTGEGPRECGDLVPRNVTVSVTSCRTIHIVHYSSRSRRMHTWRDAARSSSQPRSDAHQCRSLCLPVRLGVIPSPCRLRRGRPCRPRVGAGTLNTLRYGEMSRPMTTSRSVKEKYLSNQVLRLSKCKSRPLGQYLASNQLEDHLKYLSIT